MTVTDANGNNLEDGSSIKLAKGLKVKDAGITLKRGVVVKNIRLTDNKDEIDCKINKTKIVLRTEFVQKR
jgi:protein PhnA